MTGGDSIGMNDGSPRVGVADADPEPGAVLVNQGAPLGTPQEETRADDPGEPRWARPLLAVLLVVTAVAYLWDLDRNGWGNTFYAAAVQAGTHSWSAMFYGSFDWGNYITVDKPPVSLWIMSLSGRIFGFNSWSMLAPEALLGVASVGLLYGAVRRAWGASAGLIAAALLALTPAAALMFRFNNPDAALTFLLVTAAYALTRAQRNGHTGWLLVTAALIGTAFLAKSLQAFLVVPGLAVAYLACAPGRLLRRLWQLLAAGGVMLISSLWWPLVVDLTPADRRPFVGGSTTNSVLQLAFGYNGLGRITGQQGGPGGAGGPRGGGGFSGAAGWSRLFNDLFGGFIAWGLPAALIGVVAAVWLLRRRPRTDPRWASLVLWTGWTLVTAAVFSFADGIIHTYYAVALAPGVAALAAMTLPILWQHRSSLVARLFLAAATAATAVTGFVLLGQASDWYPWLRWSILVIGTVSAILLVVPVTAGRLRLPAPAVAAVAGSALAAGVAGPLAWSLVTIGTTHTGSVPDAGPARAASRAWVPGRVVTGPGGAQEVRPGNPPGLRGGFGGASVDADLVAALKAGASGYRWVAAASSSMTAGPLQLAVNAPVMSLGGFTGGDPAITLDEFKALVAAGQVHYYLADGFGGMQPPGGMPAPGGGRSESGSQGAGNTPGFQGAPGGPGGRGVTSSIAVWVRSMFTSTTTGTTTVYDLTKPLAASS